MSHKTVKANEKINEDRKISISLLSIFIVLMFQSLTLYYFNIMDTMAGTFVQFTSKLVAGLLFLYSLSIALRRSSIMILLVYSFSIIVFLGNYLYFIQNRMLLNDILLPYFFICLPCFVYSYSVIDYKIFNNIARKSSNIIFTISIITGLLIYSNNISIGTYSMSLGYLILLPTIIYLKNFLDNFSVKDLILFVISILLILSIGSRGPIICVGAYILLYFIINIRKITRKKFLFYMLTSIFVVLGAFYIEPILLFWSNMLEIHGMHSRSIRLFMQEGVYLSGRANIYREILNQISSHPVIGIGIAGDRLYTGTYSHNIILEIISGFGIIFGSFILIILFIVTIKSLFSKDIEGVNLILIWFVVGFIPMFISGSYLTYFQFWIFLGLTTRFLKKQKIKAKNDTWSDK